MPDTLAKDLCAELAAATAEIETLKIAHHADQLTEAYEAGKRDAIPEGWVLVPKEPTISMIDAITNHTGAAYGVDYRTRKGYAAMIAAAPLKAYNETRTAEVLATTQSLASARAEIERLTAREWELIGEKAPILVAARRALAAEQAKNMVLRECLSRVDGALLIPYNGGAVYAISPNDHKKFKEALSTPADTSALEAMIAKAGEKMREKCVEIADCSSIRALPGVTLEDLK